LFFSAALRESRVRLCVDRSTPLGAPPSLIHRAMDFLLGSCGRCLGLSVIGQVCACLRPSVNRKSWAMAVRAAKKRRPGNGLDWAPTGRTVSHSTRSPVLRCGHLIQRSQLKHSPHRFKPMQRTTGMHSESGTVLDWGTDAAQRHRFR
jgi:hypothetical protein